MTRALFIILFLFTAGWCGYWWIGSSAQQNGLENWFSERQGDGWVSDYKSLKIQGFPNRFDTKITNLHLADPRSGWAWAAPEFQVLMLSYKPNHIIAVWPPEQVVSTPFENITIGANDIRASVKFQANTALVLNAVTAEMDQITLTSNAGWVSAMKSAKLATRQTNGVEFSHDIFFQANDLKPAHIFKNIIDPDDLLPDVFDTVRSDITAGFDAPWDRYAVEGRKPEMVSLEVKDFTATWGELDFQAKGELQFDTAGYPTGKIAVRAKNWKDMLALGVSSGLIPVDLKGTLEAGLGLLAGLSGNPNTIDVPISFKNRVMSIGPIPIGRAPQLQINP